MKTFALILGLLANILASKCNELTSKTINNYVISDSTVLIKDTVNLKPSIEVAYGSWTNISDSYWIWFTSNFSDKTKSTIEFSKAFNIPGRIISGKIEYLVDNILKNLSFNGKTNANQLLISSHLIISTLDITNLLNSGANYLDLTVENVLTSRTLSPGGICFLITVVSEVFI